MQRENDKKPSSDIKREIGERISAARVRKGLTQPEAMAAIGWEGAVSRLSNYEKGIREPDAATMIEIAKGLDTTPAALMFGEPPIASSDLPEAVAQGKLPKHVTKALQAVISSFRADVNPSIFDAFTLLLSELTAANSARMASQNKETSPFARAEKELIDRSKGKTAEHLRDQEDAKHAAKRRQSR